MLVVFQLCASDLQNIELVIHRTQEFDATGVSQQRRDSDLVFWPNSRVCPQWTHYLNEYSREKSGRLHYP